ncbi:hypothetical protein J6590_054381 [Homalodisca vitripennis]|nr:hypothetical protein J6590_054381 [Homalodisca vitripennis]
MIDYHPITECNAVELSHTHSTHTASRSHRSVTLATRLNFQLIQTPPLPTPYPSSDANPPRTVYKSRINNGT